MINIFGKLFFSRPCIFTISVLAIQVYTQFHVNVRFQNFKIYAKSKAKNLLPIVRQWLLFKCIHNFTLM